jgi:hypothetical protein
MSYLIATRFHSRRSSEFFVFFRLLCRCAQLDMPPRMQKKRNAHPEHRPRRSDKEQKPRDHPHDEIGYQIQEDFRRIGLGYTQFNRLLVIADRWSEICLP